MRLAKVMIPAAAILAIGTAASPARADVLIGNTSPLTGPLSWVGAHYLVGTELAATLDAA
jgi:ABC-type branched-subunit amino acid transport system substrate-binding protein